MFNNFYLILLLSLTLAFCVFQSNINGYNTTLFVQGQVMQAASAYYTTTTTAIGFFAISSRGKYYFTYKWSKRIHR